MIEYADCFLGKSPKGRPVYDKDKIIRRVQQEFIESGLAPYVAYKEALDVFYNEIFCDKYRFMTLQQWIVRSKKGLQDVKREEGEDIEGK